MAQYEICKINPSRKMGLAHLARLAKDRRAELKELITARVRPEESLWHYEHRQPQGIKTVVVHS